MNHDFWDDFIIEGIEDEVGLWQIIRRVKQGLKETEHKQVKSLTLSQIRDVLETKLMQIGMFEHTSTQTLDFQIWSMDIDNIVLRIEKEWADLGREPNIGDIAWLITTDQGKIEAEKILDMRNRSKNISGSSGESMPNQYLSASR